MELTGKHILLGVTGGIAAYKAAELVRLLGKQGATVQVVMTEAATRFVTPVTFQALSGRPVYVDPWDARPDNNMAHIDLSREADCVLVAPASADFLAKVAGGRADDLLSTLVLARDCPLLVAPAMNRQMWENPATQRNVGWLRQDGIAILGPDAGSQACGEVGDGRMLEPGDLVEALIAFFRPKLLAGRHVVITAGPTFEAMDPVRGMTNLSSGKMGFALARAAAQAGARVTLVAGPVSQATPYGVDRVDVMDARSMLAAVETAVADRGEVFIGVAAVADYRPATVAARKIKKSEQAGEGETMAVPLLRNPDILATVAARPAPPLCVGFAAESHDLHAYAEAKRRTKGVPLVVGNLVADGFGGDDNEVVLFDGAGAHPLPRAGKTEIAWQLVAHIAQLLAGAVPTPPMP